MGECTKCGGGTQARLMLCDACTTDVARKSRKRTAKSMAAGLCVWCRAPREPDREGKAVCGPCAEKNKMRNKKVSENREAAGLCRRCGKTGPRPGRTLCGPCAATTTRVQRRYFERRRAAGLCKLCGRKKPADRADKAVCAECVKKMVERQQARRVAS